MINIIKVLMQFHNEKPTIYQGEGAFRKLIVRFNPGLSFDEIENLSKKHSIILPKEYITLLNFSNGISFFEYGDCKFYNLKDAFAAGIDEWVKEGYLCIARYYEDSIYLKCNGSTRNIFVSEEGFSELRPMDMSLSAFIDASLCSGFSYFWLWGTESQPFCRQFAKQPSITPLNQNVCSIPWAKYIRVVFVSC